MAQTFQASRKKFKKDVALKALSLIPSSIFLGLLGFMVVMGTKAAVEHRPTQPPTTLLLLPGAIAALYFGRLLPYISRARRGALTFACTTDDDAVVVHAGEGDEDIRVAYDDIQRAYLFTDPGDWWFGLRTVHIVPTRKNPVWRVSVGGLEPPTADALLALLVSRNPSITPRRT